MVNKIKVNHGDTYGKLTIVCEVGKSGKHRMFRCACECGLETEVYLSNIRSGYTTSCGCNHKESTAMIKKTHSMSRTPTYITWRSMKSRCGNTKNPSYANYGARGIRVCERWYNSFERFIEDMGERSIGSSIDRIDVNGDYEPGNCRWSNTKTQARNKRNTLMADFNGKTKPLIEHCEDERLSYKTVFKRIRQSGYSIEQALQTKPNRKSK